MDALAPAPSPAPLLEVTDLRVSYRRAGDPAPVRAVRGVTFALARGETLGLVGESGSGKSSVARALIRLAPVSGGRVRYGGTELTGLSEPAFFPYRKRIQMVFQDPLLSLNPRATVEDILAEPQRIHFPALNRAGRRERAVALLREMGLSDALLGRYPQEMSGGQRQRVGIARALAVEPELLLCDEAVSALDVSVQAQVLDLLMDLRKARRLTVLFISHDLAVVEHLSDRVAVMQGGRIVELADAEELYRQPRTAYARALLAAVPQL